MAQFHFWAFAVVLATTKFSDASYSAGATGYSCPTLFNFYADIYDCTKFYRCFWGEAYAFSCPSGTRWSQSLLTCDHEYNVPCHSSPTYVTAPAAPTTVSSYVDYGYADNTAHDYNHDGYGAQSYYYNSFNDGFRALGNGPKNYGTYGTSYYQTQNRPRGYTQPPGYGSIYGHIAGNYYDYHTGYNYAASGNGGYGPSSRLVSFLAGHRKK